MEHKNTWTKYNTAQIAEVMDYNEGYKAYISKCKTERECVDYIVNAVEKKGYRELQDVIKKGEKLSTGDKVYAVCMNNIFGRACAHRCVQIMTILIIAHPSKIIWKFPKPRIVYFR